MTIVISILLVINLLLLLNFYMHMFQLNSYFFKKYLFWIKGNIKKVFIRNILVLLSLIILFNNDIVNILSIIILICSIIINIPKSKAKIPLIIQ